MKKLLTFLMFFLLATAMAQMQAAEETFTLSKGAYNSNAKSISWTGDKGVCVILQEQGSTSATAPSGSYLSTPRWYASNVITFTAPGYKITGATVVCTTEGYATALKNSTYSNGASASVSSTTVTITANGDFTITMGAQSRISSIKITYESDAPAVAYTVTLGDDNTKLTETAAGAGVTLPSRNNVGDYTFVGWSTSNYTEESTNVPTTIAAGKYNPKANVTLYPMYKRTGEGQGQDAVLSQTLQYDTWTYSGSTTNKSGYRLFHSGSYIESAEFDLSKLTKVIVYGGTFGGSGYNSLTIGDGTNTWMSGTVSGTSNTGKNEFTNGNALSGTGKLRITSNSGSNSGSGTGVRISKVEIYTLGLVDYYISTPVAPVVKTPTTTAFAVETVTKTVGDADFTEAATLTPNEAGSLTYSSSNTGVATVDNAGLVHIAGAGTTTIKAEFAGNDNYEASSASYELTVNAATLVSIKVDGNPNKSYYKAGEAFVHNGMWVIATFSDGTQDHDFKQGVTWSYDPEILTASTQQVTVTATAASLSSSKSVKVYVSKKDASVAVETVEVEVGKTAIISATTTPADAELTYTVTEGADKISIADGVITGVAEGTATVKATFAGNDEYDTAETTFTVNVIPERHEATIDLSTTNDISGTPTTELIKWEKNGFVITNEKKNEKSTDVTNYYPGTTGKSYTSTRFYNTHTLTITPADGRAITKVEYTATTQDYATTMAGSAWTNASASADGTTVTITPTDGTEAIVAYLGGTTGGTSFTIYYEDATPVVRTLDHIAVVGEYKTDYTEGDAFVKATVMAYYVEEGVDPVDVTNNANATFSGYDLSAETSGEQTVNVSYTEGEVTATTSYTINFTAVTKRTVTIVPPVNGQLKVVVKATGAEIATGARVADGTVLKITNTPDEGYVLRKIVVTDTDKHNYTAQDKEITVNGIDVTINAIFIKGDNFTYTWSVNGQVASQDVYVAGATVTAPAVTAGQCPAGKTFMGWSRTATVKEDNFTPAVLDETAVTDRTYFAVFATAETSGDGGSTYYEKVPSTWTDWTNGDYLLVYETSSTAGVAFDGNAYQAQNNKTVTIENGIITDKNGAAEIVMTASSGGYFMNVKGTNNYLAYYDDNLRIQERGGDAEQADINRIRPSIEYKNERWEIKFLNDKGYLGYSTSQKDFRTRAWTGISPIQFYVKKNAGTTTYSDYTTGMTVDPHQFQLVTDLDTLNKVGREYIIVTKYRNEAGSRTIYGLSVDNADSRTENGKEGTSKTTTNFRRGETGVTFSHGDYFASIDNKISVLTLGGSEGAWTFNSAAGYLVKGGNATETFLRINSASANATIAKDNLDVATIKFANATEREVFLNINGGYPRYGAYAHNNLTDTDKKFNYAASYLYWREALNEESLAEIEANGISGTNYTVTDELDVVYVQDNFAWAKDAHGSSYAYRTNEPEYDATWYPVGNSFDTNNYDQSNWIKLVFSKDQVGAAAAAAIAGKRLNRSAVTGVYTGHKDRFHEIKVNTDLSVNIQGDAEYTPNVYTMASFWDENIYDYAVAQNDRKFFFMNPKIEEYCIVTEAMWDGSKFVVPSGTTTDGVKLNEAGFDGGFTVDWKLSVNDDQIGNLEEALNASPSNRYTFEAIIVKTEPSLTPKEDGPAKAATAKDVTLGSTHFVAYPIGFTAPDDHIVTDVKDVNVAGREVKSVRYYDVAGRSYGEAQPGINIVVTEYTDGSHSAAKMVR